MTVKERIEELSHFAARCGIKLYYMEVTAEDYNALERSLGELRHPMYDEGRGIWGTRIAGATNYIFVYAEQK